MLLGTYFPFLSFACASSETQNINTQAIGFRTLGATVQMCHTTIFSCCSSVFIGTYEKPKQFGPELAFPMTWQSYIIWPHSSPAWRLQFGIKQDKSGSTISTGRDTNKVVMQIHLKCSGMTYNYKEILHFSYQKNGSHIWNYEIPSLSEMQVPDQRVKLQTHRQVGMVTTTHTEVLVD